MLKFKEKDALSEKTVSKKVCFHDLKQCIKDGYSLIYNKRFHYLYANCKSIVIQIVLTLSLCSVALYDKGSTNK